MKMIVRNQIVTPQMPEMCHKLRHTEKGILLEKRHLHLLFLILFQQRNNILFNLHWWHLMSIAFNCTSLTIH